MRFRSLPEGAMFYFEGRFGVKLKPIRWVPRPGKELAANALIRLIGSNQWQPTIMPEDAILKPVSQWVGEG